MGRLNRHIPLFLLAATICLVPQTAWATSEIPMILIVMPAMAIGLIPTIIIEGFIMEKRLPISRKQAYISVGISNAVSTIIGIPLTWGTLFLVQYILMQYVNLDYHLYHALPSSVYKVVATIIFAPWLISYENDLYWMIPLAMIVLIFPFFFASWKIEVSIMEKLHKKISHRKINQVCFSANAITYMLLFLYPIGMLILY